MFGNTRELFPSRIDRLCMVMLCGLAVLAIGPGTARAQKPTPPVDGADTPALNAFKGVQIGTKADDARKKLGSPRDKSAEQDFYLINDNQAVQIYYDKTGSVNAISIDFMNGASSIPTCKDVLGSEVQAKPDGSVYKLNRYPKAGYWVSYSRTAGNSPTITITMQKIDH